MKKNVIKETKTEKMKKFYVMLAALIVALSASADYYLAGDVNGWAVNSNDYKFTTNPSNTSEYMLTLSELSGMFKITNGSWDNNCSWGYGPTSTLYVNQNFTSYRNGGNITVAEKITNATIILKPDNANFTIYVTGTVAAKDAPVYLVGNFNDKGTSSTDDAFQALENNVHTYTTTFSEIPAGQKSITFQIVQNGNVYGPASSDIPAEKGVEMPVTENSKYSWYIRSAGTYTFSYNPNNMTLTVNSDDFVNEPYESVPGAPDELYIVGNICGWSTANAVKMERHSNVLINGNLYADFYLKADLPGASESDNNSYFRFLNSNTKDWAATQYGATSDNQSVSVSTDKRTEVALNKNISGDKNYVVPAGEYVIHVYIGESNSHITMIKTDDTVSVEGIEAAEGEAVYYTLQGVKVAEPESGLYIKVVNGKASKVLVRK